MNTNSILKYPVVSISTNVTLPISDKDRSEEDLKNFIGYTLFYIYI
jgi:hypothetical protein